MQTNTQYISGMELVADKASLGSVPESFHFLQRDFWADFKCAHGWKKLKVRGTAEAENSKYDFSVNILVRTVGKFFSIAYIPMGLELTPESPFSRDNDLYADLLSEFSVKAKALLPADTFCLRMDPPVEFDELAQKCTCSENWKKKNGRILKKSLNDIQPPDTVLLDLEKTEEELLSAMKPKWRYNIKLAEKKGVTVSACGAEKIEDFYHVFEETAKRDGIAIHAKSYYKDLLERGNSAETEKSGVKTTLYLAAHENDVLAGIITLFTDTEAVYLFGASSNNKRNLMPAYFLQWRAICDAKAFGAKTYDFYGCPPDDNENHPMHGLFRFKTGFGGRLVHRIGSFDAVYKPCVYGLYIFAEKARAFYHKKLKKMFIRKGK